MPHRQREAMIGPGGHIRVPLSEAAELQKIYDILNEVPNATGIRRAMALIIRLQSQVSAGYHRNPYTPFRVVGVLGKAVHTIAYKHAKDHKLYKHDFNGENAEVLAVERHGKRELLITSPDGLPLWDEF